MLFLRLAILSALNVLVAVAFSFPYWSILGTSR